MLVLFNDPLGFPDDEDPTRRWLLPIGLVPVTPSGRPPDVALVTDPDGGVLTLRLAASWPELADHERRAPIAAGRVRVVTRGLGADGVGDWSPAHLGGGLLVDRRLPLDAADAMVLRAALQAGGAAVDVDVELDVRGRTPSWPWIVRANGPGLAGALRALLGGEDVAWPRVVDAFLGLGGDVLVWHATEPGAIRPPADHLLAQGLAAAARGVLVERTDIGWRVIADPLDQVDLSLAVAGLVVATHRLTWSFSTFLQTADLAAHVTDLARSQPLQATDLHVVNEVPLAPDGIRRIDLDVVTNGPTGTVTCQFAPDAADAARLRFVRLAGADLELTWRARTTVDVDGRPVVLQGDARPTGLLLRLTAADLGLDPVRLEAEESLLAVVAGVEITIGTRTVRLDADRPVIWVVGRTAPATATVVLVDGGGGRHDLGSVPVTDRTVAVTAAQAGVGAPTEVRLGPTSWNDIAYLAIQVEGAGWRTVEPDTSLVWPVRRVHHGATSTIRYRTRQVSRAEGVTRPMVASGWRDAVGEVVEVVV